MEQAFAFSLALMKKWGQWFGFVMVLLCTIQVHYVVAFGAQESGAKYVLLTFSLLLYLAALYEITIKPGIRQKSAYLSIFKEVMICWIVPVGFGVLISSVAGKLQ